MIQHMDREPNSDGINPKVEKPHVTDEARKLHEALAKKEGAKALIIAVDDNEFKRLAVRVGLEIPWPAIPNTALSIHSNGEDAINIYQAFRNTDQHDHPTPIVLVMDSQLAKDDEKGVKYKTGLEVLSKISEISDENEWPMPLIVGGSTDPRSNEEFKTAFPSSYVCSSENGNAVIEAVSTKLTEVT